MLGIQTVEIFRTQQKGQFLMRHIKTFMQEDTKSQEYFDVLKTISETVHKCVARIHSLKVTDHNALCMKHKIVETFTNYYSLTFQQVIEQRKRDDVRFTAGQLWYMLNSMLNLSISLQRLNLYFGVYLPQNLMMTPEGYLKVYLYHLTPNNRHFLHDISFNKRLPLSPECLIDKWDFSISNITSELDNQIQLPQCQIFNMGMVIIQAIMSHSVKKYFKKSYEEFSQKSNTTQSDFLKNIYDEQQLKIDLNQLKNIYPTLLLNLLSMMCRTNPKQRMTFAQAKAYIDENRESINISRAIRMQQEENNYIKVSFRSEKQYQNTLQNIINISNKLSANPIISVQKKQSMSKNKITPMNSRLKLMPHTTRQSRQNEKQYNDHISQKNSKNRLNSKNNKGLILVSSKNSTEQSKCSEKVRKSTMRSNFEKLRL